MSNPSKKLKNIMNFIFDEMSLKMNQKSISGSALRDKLVEMRDLNPCGRLASYSRRILVIWLIIEI